MGRLFIEYPPTKSGESGDNMCICCVRCDIILSDLSLVEKVTDSFLMVQKHKIVNVHIHANTLECKNCSFTLGVFLHEQEVCALSGKFVYVDCLLP